MTRIILAVAVLLALGGMAAATHAPQAQAAGPAPSVVEDGGGQDWVCEGTEASYGKTITGYGFYGYGAYQCKHKGVTSDAIICGAGHKFWQHHSSWPYYTYWGDEAWEYLGG